MSNFIERVQKVEAAGDLYLKGRTKLTEIARELDVSPAEASSLIKEWKTLVRSRAESDPDFLDRIAENTIEMIDSIDMLLSEAWSVYEKAKEFEAMNSMNTSLKLAMDITERKAKLLQLMGAKIDSGSTARLQRAERVNEIVSGIIKEVVADCPKCRAVAQVRLAEAFKLMGREAETSELQELEQGEEIFDAEIVAD